MEVEEHSVTTRTPLTHFYILHNMDVVVITVTQSQSSVAMWARLHHMSIKKGRVEQDEAQLFQYSLSRQGVTGYLNLTLSWQKYRRVLQDYILRESVCERRFVPVL